MLYRKKLRFPENKSACCTSKVVELRYLEERRCSVYNNNGKRLSEDIVRTAENYLFIE
jgi:hypothetical protein